MRLYAKVSSERATKGQGGNDYLYVKFQDDEQIVARVDFAVDIAKNGQKLYYLEIADKTGVRCVNITPLGGFIETKAEKKKDEGWCKDCRKVVAYDKEGECPHCGRQVKDDTLN